MAPVKKKAAKAAKKNVVKSMAKSSAKKAPAKKIPAKKAPAVKKSAARTAIPGAGGKVPPLRLASRALIPLEDRLLIFVEGPSETTAGGIIIPGTAASRPNRGKVLAKGRGKRNKKGQLRPLDVNVGDVVIFPEFSGTQITLDGADLLILREEEILGITD